MFKTKSFPFFLTLLLLPLLHAQVHGQSLSDSTSEAAPASADTVIADSSTPPEAADVRTGQGPYTIGGISVTGAQYLDKELLVLSSGLEEGQKISSRHDPAISRAIRKLWDQGFFSDVSIELSRVEGDKAYLNLIVRERPRLSGVVFQGLNKTQETEIKDKLKIVQYRMVTEGMKNEVRLAVKDYFSEKGFYKVRTRITESKDTAAVNSVILVVDVDKGQRVRINQINISGNFNASAPRLKSKMKGSKEMPRLSLYPASSISVYEQPESSFGDFIARQGYFYPSRILEALNPYFRWNVFSGSKYIPSKFEEDKNNVVAYYNSMGFRDIQIEKDTVYYVENGHLNIDMKVREGRKYYFGNIEWKGNTKYSDSVLSMVLGIKKGDVYNLELLQTRLQGGMPGMGSPDISSLYLDDGYLFFQVVPIEKSIEGDTIHYELVIREGPQATIKKITISGNERTNDHVLRRELFTLPGHKFSRADIVSSIRQIANLGYIDPEKVEPNFIPNMEEGTVDIDFRVAEKSNDQLELSAGYGGRQTGFMGTVGIVFNNFSLRNLFKFQNWDPLPMGDGQKLSIRYQSNGLWYNSANISFTEPWLGGKKPTALTVSAIYGRQSISSTYTFYGGNPNEHYIRNFGGGVSISKRLRWPDNSFIFSYGLNYQNYYLKDFDYFGIENFSKGSANNLFFRLSLARNSVDQPLYPRSGANINFTFQFTPPFSMFSETDYTLADPQTKYKWVEYHKYRFTAEWYQRIVGDLVFKLAAKYGFLGYYNRDIGFSPFERFSVGGDGLAGFNNFIGRDVIAHRGYDMYVPGGNNLAGGTIFNKYTAEIRYPFSLNPSATIFGLAFVEAANGWYDYKSYNPFKLYRSAGVGVRIYLPMFGLLGLDYGIGFDNLGPGVKLGQAAKFTFMLGFEPD